MYDTGLMPLSNYLLNYVPTVGSKTVAMFGYFALHAMWSLIAWESLLALAE